MKHPTSRSIVALALGLSLALLLSWGLAKATLPVAHAYEPGVNEIELIVTKYAAPDPVQPGAQLTYTIRITNTGDVDLHATITDTLPLYVTPGTSVGTLILPGGKVGITWTMVLTAPGGVWETTFVVTVDETYTGPLTNVVEATTVEGVMDTASCTTIVADTHTIYLPLVVRAWPPVPHPPTLNPIDNADGDDSYVVSWTGQTALLPITYTLQEATGAAFTTGLREVCATTQLSCAVSGNPAGTYHYRVRGTNTWNDGMWSNVQTATVPAACPTVSINQYGAGIAFQVDLDDPVRPAYNHADKNLALRSYAPNTDPGFKRELVNYGSGDPTPPPQLAALFYPHRVPTFGDFYRVHDWDWANPPNPGTRGGPIMDWPVTALGMQTTPGEVLYVPTSGYDIGGGMEVIVLFADEDTVALKYARQDSACCAGYTVHVDNICTDPNLLVLYDQLDDPGGPRYVFADDHSYDLPNLSGGQPFGVARGSETVVAIVDSGTFMDTRSCNEWWQIRPGYTGSCPPP